MSELEEEYQQYFTAWKRYKVKHESPHYDFGAEFIYLPNPEPDASTLYEFIHEWVHSQLGGGLHGIVLQSLSALTGHAEKPVIEDLREIYNLPELMGTETRWDLVIHGSTDRLLGSAEEEARQVWYSLLNDELFHTATETFLEINCPAASCGVLK